MSADFASPSPFEVCLINTSFFTVKVWHNADLLAELAAGGQYTGAVTRLRVESDWLLRVSADAVDRVNLPNSYAVWIGGRGNTVWQATPAAAGSTVEISGKM